MPLIKHTPVEALIAVGFYRNYIALHERCTDQNDIDFLSKYTR